MHPLLVPAELVIVQVVDDDVVRPCLAVTQSTRRLPPSAGEELDSVRRLELALLPRAVGPLLPEVGDDALVVLQFRLYVAEQPDGAVLALADHHHEVDEPFGLEHQP